MSEFDGKFNDEIQAILDKKMRAIWDRRESLIEAWVASTGLSPLESCLVQQEINATTRMWIEPQTDRCMTHRAENTALKKRLDQYELAYSTLFLELAHGDDVHRDWLRDKMTDHLRKYIEEGVECPE